MKAIKTISFWRKPLAGIFLTFVLKSSVYAQCVAPFKTITYDTSIAGTGNNSHVFTVSQFDPNLGTLVSTRINSVISVNYGFTLQNVESVPRNFSVSVARNDHIQSAAMSSPYDNSIDTAIGTFPLNPGASVSRSPYTVLYRYVNADSTPGNPANFIGNGKVSFNYKPLTYTNLTGSNMYYYSATANDTIHFSVTYTYCDNVVLAAAMYSFDAFKKDDRQIALTWQVNNEQPGRFYDVEKSADGIHFNDLGSLPSADHEQTARYDYDYLIHNEERIKLYFRLRIIDAAGSPSYSEIKMVDMSSAGKGFFLYPNPSDQFVNIVFSHFNNWEVEIISADGALQQRNRFINAGTARMNFNHTLAAGTYFARILDLATSKSRLLGFVVK